MTFKADNVTKMLHYLWGLFMLQSMVWYPSDCIFQPGLLLPGSIRKMMDYGAFVDLGGGFVGLAPNKVSRSSPLLILVLVTEGRWPLQKVINITSMLNVMVYSNGTENGEEWVTVYCVETSHCKLCGLGPVPILWHCISPGPVPTEVLSE